jgi:hypothetical protein
MRCLSSDLTKRHETLFVFYQVGEQSNTLTELITMPKRVGVIRNALDYSDDNERLKIGRDVNLRSCKASDSNPKTLILEITLAVNLSLRSGSKTLMEFGLSVGNAFILRRAMRQSGLDKILRDKSQDEILFTQATVQSVCRSIESQRPSSGGRFKRYPKRIQS